MKLSFRKYLQHTFAAACLTAGAAMLTSCFTGVEGTKKITLSKADKVQLAPEPEETYLSDIPTPLLKTWEKGKKFVVTDSKIMYVFEGRGVKTLEAGDVVEYEDVDVRTSPTGEENALILFTHEGETYSYNLRKDLKTAVEEFSSFQLPMLIDEEILREMESKLRQKPLWIKTGLWYDDQGNYKKGKKYSKVEIESLEPGNTDFPAKVNFRAENGEKGHIFMNYGNSGNESRSFSHLFSLQNIRKNYPSITDEVWEVIQSGGVRTGMTKEECKLSLGNPQEINTGHDYSRTLDIWQYSDGTYLQFADGILVNFRK